MNKYIAIITLAVVLALALSACSPLALDAKLSDNGITSDTVAGQDRVTEPYENNDATGGEGKPQGTGNNGGRQGDTGTSGNQNSTSAGNTQPAINKAVYIKALITGLNVRKAASSSSASLGSLDAGDMTVYLAKEGKWYKTYYRNQIAYISSTYSVLHEMEAGNAVIESVVLTGARLLGTPYIYGAIRLHNGNGKVNSKSFDINKFDCSSFTQYMYFYGADIILDTTTRTQIKQGVSVQKNQIMRGDLMFFTNSGRYYKTGIERVGHVALYLGDNYILHTASDYAVIEQISNLRWSYYIETRRYI